MLPEYIKITNNLQLSLNSLYAENNFSKTGVLVDENTYSSCYPLIEKILPDHKVFMIRSGEENKTLDTCINIWKCLTDNHFDRRSLLINLGGGVIGDMGGFCAATFKRGIDFVNIPTTLLSQVDASIGGKLGVDFEGLKNHIGVFKEPKQVIIFTEFIKSLDKRQIKSGYAEIIKHSLIADQNSWKHIVEKDLDDGNWEAFVSNSVKIKNRIVAEDPLEKGLRKVLNFGHTIGHAIESFYLDSDDPLLHGEAIAIGMICESYLSFLMAGLPESEFKAIELFLIRMYGTINIDEKHLLPIAEATLQDKKNENSDINCTLISTMGHAIYDQKISLKQVIESLQYYKKRVDRL